MASAIANSNGDVAAAKGREKVIIDTDPGVGMWHFVLQFLILSVSLTHCLALSFLNLPRFFEIGRCFMGKIVALW